MKFGSAVRFGFPLLLGFLLLGLLAGCGRDERDKVISEGYIGSPTAALRDRLGPSYTNTATLKAGDHVHVVQKRRRWVRIRAENGAEGWLEERHIIPRETFEQAHSLVKSTVARPSQGRARARSPLNLHVEPTRKSPSFFQLKEGEECDVLAHRAMEKPLPGGGQRPAEQPDQPEPAPGQAGQPGQPGRPSPAAKPPAGQPAGSPAAQPPPRQEPKAAAAKKAPAAAKKGKGRKAKQAQPAGPPMEDWFLLRAKDKAGWALAPRVEMTIPDEVAQYAEGKAITAWHVLDEVQDGDQKKPQCLWATSERVGSAYDFDSIRVFIWNRARHRYETSYRERNQQGVYPLIVEG